MQGCNDCEQDMGRARFYLDHAATTPVLAPARAAMAAALESWANPSSVHAEGRAARAVLEDARRRILAGLGLPSGYRLVFTSGASEALALALTRARAESRLVSAVEHDAVLRVVPDARRIAVTAGGMIEIPANLSSLRAPLVAIQHVNNETGIVQPISEFAPIIADAGGLLLVDVAQSAGKLRLPEADMLAVSAHKLGGPPGIGALILRNDRMLDATGGQERGLRGGTENLPAIMGFAAAVEADRQWLDGLEAMKSALERHIESLGGVIIAKDEERAPWISAIRMPGVAAATQLMHFDLAGIAVSAGAACSSGSMKPSHVLAAMGHGEEEAREVVRVSFGPDTRSEAIRAFVEAWSQLFERAGKKAA